MTTRRHALGALGLPVLLALGPLFAQAQQISAPAAPSADQAQKYANNIYLGYVRSTSSALNSETDQAVRNLAEAVRTRTAIPAQGAAPLNPDTDDLSFFHFIYWPVTPDAQPLSEKARARVQDYLDTGGVILFDLRDGNGMMRDVRAARRLLGDLNIPALKTLATDHPVTKGFYLLPNLSGSSTHGVTQVEVPPPKGVEKISSVIIGDNNWGGAWAGRTVLPGSREHEMAMRAGINVVLYAYMGNIKLEPINDQLKKINQP